MTYSELLPSCSSGGALSITLDRYADNSPLDGSVTLALDGQEVAAERLGIGLLVARHPHLERPGRLDLVFTVTAGEDMDLLTATLEVPAAAAASGKRVEALTLLRNSIVQIGIGIGLLIVGLLLGRASVRRALPPMVDEEPAIRPLEAPSFGKPRVAALLLLALTATAPAAAQQALVTGEAPRRLQDGAIFVPKPSQRLLGVRTLLTENGEASAALRMIGTLVPDPNASGRVQASQNGRLEPGDAGFPTLGQSVERGQVLAYVTPINADHHAKLPGGGFGNMRAENPIPNGKAEAEIAVGFRTHHRMMHAMHIRRH